MNIPTHEYIAIDDFRESYIALTNDELKKCSDLRQTSPKNEFVCSQNSPKVQISSKTEDCAVQLLANKMEQPSCSGKLINITSELLIRLQEPNKWVATFPSKQDIYIRCNNLPTTHESVEGVGLLTLEQDCHLKTDNLILNAQQNYVSNVYEQITPSSNYSLPSLDYPVSKGWLIPKIDSPKVIKLGEIHKLKEISFNMIELPPVERPTYPAPAKPATNVLWFIVLSTMILILMTIILTILGHKCSQSGSYHTNESRLNTLTRSPPIDTNIEIRESLV